MAVKETVTSESQSSWKYVDIVGDVAKEFSELHIRNPAAAAQLGQTVRAAGRLGLPWAEVQKDKLRESSAGSAAVTAIQVGAVLMVLREGWKYAKLAAEWFRT